MLQKAPFGFLGCLRLKQNNLKPNGPFRIFVWFCGLFILTEQLLFLNSLSFKSSFQSWHDPKTYNHILQLEEVTFFLSSSGR